MIPKASLAHYIRMLGAHRPGERLKAGGGVNRRGCGRIPSSGTRLVCCIPPGEKGQRGTASPLGEYTLKPLLNFPASLSLWLLVKESELWGLSSMVSSLWAQLASQPAP